MTIENMISGSKATSIYPFNPNATPESAFAPSLLTDTPVEIVQTMDEELSGETPKTTTE